MFVSPFCVKVIDDFSVDIQKGNGCERVITCQVNGGVNASAESCENVKNPTSMMMVAWQPGTLKSLHLFVHPLVSNHQYIIIKTVFRWPS